MYNAKLAVCFVCFFSSKDKNVQSILPLCKPYHLIQAQLLIPILRYTNSNLTELPLFSLLSYVVQWILVAKMS